jgi:hypothetical protein
MKKKLFRISIAFSCFAFGLLVFQANFSFRLWLESPRNAELVSAARKADANKVRELIENGANPNGYYPEREACDKDYFSDYKVFNEVIRIKNVEVVKVFLDEGADVNLPDDDGMSPLITATSWHASEIVALLLSHGADVNYKYDNKTALDFAEKTLTFYKNFTLKDGTKDELTIAQSEKIKLMLEEAGGKKADK